MTKHATVLVVEDNPITRKMIRVALESGGFGAVEAGDGRSAKAAIEALRPDLVLMDLNLPDMDGLKLVEELRAMPQGAGVPIFAVTGSGLKLDAARSIHPGFTEILLKPVSPSDLLRMIRSHIGGSDPETRSRKRDRRVLIVDEKPLEQKLLRTLFEKRCYGVITADDGRRGLVQALQCLPDAVVSETAPGEMDGFRLCREIRKDARLCRVPVVLLSRIPVDEADRRLARAVGAVLLEVRSSAGEESVEEIEAALQNPMAAGGPSCEEPSAEDIIRHLQRQLSDKRRRHVHLKRRGTLLEAEVAVLGGLSEALRVRSSVKETVSEVFHRCLDAAGISQGAVYLRAPDGALTLDVDYGSSGNLENLALFREVMERGEPFVDVVRLQGGATGRLHRLIAPILLGDERLGVILLASTREELGDDWRAFGKAMGNQIGQALGLTRAHATLAASEERHRLLIQGLDAIVWEADPATLRFTFVSRPVDRILGYPTADWTTRLSDWTTHVHPEDRPVVLEALHEAAGRCGSHQFEYRALSSSGAVVWLRVFLFSGPEALRGVMVNVTDRRQGEEKRIRDLTLLNGMNELLAASSTMEEAYDVIGRTARELFPEESGAIFVLPTAGHAEAKAAWGKSPVLPEQGRFAPDECWALKRGKVHRSQDVLSGMVCRHLPSPKPASSLCIPMSAQGKPIGVLTITSPREDGLTDAHLQLALTIADQGSLAVSNLQLRELLRNQSVRDPLTGLFNRRYLEESMDRELERASRSGRPVGLIALDLDHFKRINDTYGHDAGDAVLRKTAECLLQSIRGSDIAARVGGEEFVLVLPDASLEVTRERAEQIRKALAASKPTYEGKPLGSVTVSAGVAMFPAHGATRPSFLHAADAALYRAKNSGRDRVVLCETVQGEA